ncbi:PVC-type heme-binding CxxCH protein [Marinimicrobium sp. ABcell2]|uniref:PVC-type heme-binding CxxCH protein n=1 Tax=Marinimicrobium sp. ABcell2 TaxID=3069751 RepID=UPI0027AEDAA8|nr:PVC-type heme-binding CxxCH protein [Marinimicrobium sp. ABcell2]MDQ2075758.1 ThuA domain-containing protein [Marinimicrobium sp. ABcell2]
MNTLKIKWTAWRSRLGTLVLAALLLPVIGCSSAEDETTLTAASGADKDGVINMLFIGHGHRQGEGGYHLSYANAPLFNQALGAEKIFLEYVEDLDKLTDEGLANYDAVMMYANYNELGEGERVLERYVENGGAFLPIHSASACFGCTERYTKLVGARFVSHGEGVFNARVAPGQESHPIMDGFEMFETWDETYVHADHNEEGRTVLMYREDEPWTWVREQGQGRVFYTAYGHDHRTWEQPQFHDLLIRGILWSVGDDKRKANRALVKTLPEGVYRESATIPNYRRVEPEPKFQEAFSVEDSMALTMVQDGFELQLFVSEPDIVNPVAFTWDEKGRLFVVESVDYPHDLVEDGEGNDRITMCEDTNRDGRADRCEVFADGLSIPTGIMRLNGGFVVAQAPDFLFLKDTTGDGKADVREVLNTGWGTFDTHAGPSNLLYGHDNRLWGVVGYSATPETEHGESFQNGPYRMNLDGSNIEPVGQFNNNTWGLAFSEDFEVFGSTANNAPIFHVPLWRNYVYGRHEEVPPRMSAQIEDFPHIFPATYNYLQVDAHGRYTAGSGLDIYTARTFPEAYWNRGAFMGEPTAHLMGQFFIDALDNSVGYVAKNRGSILTSTDEWLSPVHMEVGPDGHVWIADWYNFIIQHNPIPTEESAGFNADAGHGNAHVNPLRDRQHGRIYRLVAKNAPEYQPLDLSNAETSELVETLSNDNMFWRLTAQRLLVTEERADAIPALQAILTGSPQSDALGLDVASIHAIWTLQGLGVFTATSDEAAKVVRSALNHPSGATRKNAVQALVENATPVDLALAAQSLEDEDPRARLWALLALAEQEPSAKAGEQLMRLRTQLPIDEWTAQAFALAALSHDKFYWQVLNDADFTVDGSFQENYETLEQTPEYSLAMRFLAADAKDLTQTLQGWRGLPMERLALMSAAVLDVWRDRGQEPSASELTAFQAVINELDGDAQMPIKLRSSGLELSFDRVEEEAYAEYHAKHVFEPHVWGWGVAVPDGQTIYRQSCAGCHGGDAGGDRGQAAPPLAGMENWYVQTQLQKFYAGVRGTHFRDPDGISMRAALDFLDVNPEPNRPISHLGHYLVTLDPIEQPATVEGNAELGAQHYATCASCHGAQGQGNRELEAPGLAGQADWYLLTQLRNYRSGARGSDPRDPRGQEMAIFANMLPDDQALRDVVAYIRTLEGEQ